MTKGRPANSPNCKYLTWKYSVYNEETSEWTTKKYITIKEIEEEYNIRLRGETVKKLMKRDEEFDPNVIYSPRAFWNKYRNIKIEKIHETGFYVFDRYDR